MTSIPKFDSEIYSEELYTVTESEYDEVMSLMAEDESGWQGYEYWSRENEETAWEGSRKIDGILIKKACEHTHCPHTQCAKAVRIGGIEI
jgi:hypothetical protein